MGSQLLRYQLLTSGYEDLGQDVQLRLSFQLLRFIALWAWVAAYGFGVAALSAPAGWLSFPKPAEPPPGGPPVAQGLPVPQWQITDFPESPNAAGAAGCPPPDAQNVPAHSWKIGSRSRL